MAVANGVIDLGVGFARLKGIRSAFREDECRWLFWRTYHVVVCYEDEESDHHFLFDSAADRDGAYQQLLSAIQWPNSAP